MSLVASGPSFPEGRFPLAHFSAGTAHSPLLLQVLREAGIDVPLYERAVRDAHAIGCDAADELVGSGRVGERELAQAIARAFRMPFGLPTPMDRVLETQDDPEARFLRTCTLGLETKLFVSPRLETLDHTIDWLRQWEGLPTVVTTIGAVRSHQALRSMPDRSNAARLALSADRPDWSARNVLTASQGYLFGILTCVFLFAALQLGTVLWTVAHLLLSLLFLACTLFRLTVLADLDSETHRARRERERRENALQLPVGQLPVYTVLVALYREEEMARPLVEALTRLDWPRSRLDVKLICEADDLTTIAAVAAAIEAEAGFELVRVPPSEPRTKPKALNHALPLARGEFVVLYDAEDRPHPDQLLEAFVAFRSAGPDLGCVQAPLVIRNGGRNWLAALFAVEYAVLFRALLPFLARRKLPIPLGGTSNHFRRSVLTRIGSWDSHNVAEDADLGIRLARFGYRTDVITAPTCEIAPERFGDWCRQRSRWIKGWIQTYLVHTRRLGQATRELGLPQMAAFQFLFFSMIAGTIMHSIFLLHLAVTLGTLLLTGRSVVGANWLMALDLFNIVAACTVFAALAARVVTTAERPLLKRLWWLWAYWLLVSLAGARGMAQLFFAPHHWDKTPHRESGDGESGSITLLPPPIAQRPGSSTIAVLGLSPPSATSSCHSPVESWNEMPAVSPASP